MGQHPRPWPQHFSSALHVDDRCLILSESSRPISRLEAEDRWPTFMHIVLISSACYSSSMPLV